MTMKKSDEAGGYLMQLQNFSVNDGEGIRTTVFMAGCPLRCQWCANPECFAFDDKNPMISYWTTESVIKQLERQMFFYRLSGGGVTFSGGEATLQEEFLRSMATKLYDKGVSLAIETCGFFDWEKKKDIFQKMDTVFIDCKLWNREKHIFYTGKDNAIILENIEHVSNEVAHTIVRIPVIEGVNADVKEMTDMFSYLQKAMKIPTIELLPYHKYGEEKYKKLHRKTPSIEFQIPSEEKIGMLEEKARTMGIQVVRYR